VLSIGVAASLACLLARARRKIQERARHSESRVRLHLVGAGPGDPELLTLAAVRALGEADLIVADFLVPETLIQRFVRKSTRILVANNKVKGKAHEAQMELQQWALEGLEQGLDVVRLKGGDPFLYGRGGEEVAFFAERGYRVEVIPGLSSSMVAPTSMGIPVTTRNFADQFVVATLHGKRDSTPGVPSPYRPNRTVVFLMSVARIDKLRNELLAAGYPSDLPVSIAERGTMEGQRNFHTTIQSIVEDVERVQLQSPAVIAVGGTAGNVAGLPTKVHWRNGGAVFEAK